MGLHGSSTTPLILQDVPVPAANLLGEIGSGHKVAFNVLNFGRFKLGAMCLGGCRLAIGESARYAATRRQFGQPIASFGAIRHKLGEMTARTYALEALMFATAGLIDEHMAAADGARQLALLAALEEFAVEASIAKVAGSETLDFVLDENVQIHGGNGYVRDYPAERHYRDARVNRIFEGTNEINRLLIPGMLMKRALKGDLALIPAAKRLLDEVHEPCLCCRWTTASAVAARRRDAGRRRVQEGDVLLGLGAAMQRFGQALTRRTGSRCCGWPIWSSTRTPPKAPCFAPEAVRAGAATPRSTMPRHGLRQRCGASGRDDGASTCSPPSPRATPSGPTSRRCGGCSGWRQPVPSPRGDGWRTPSSRAARMSSEPRRSGILVAVTRQTAGPGCAFAARRACAACSPNRSRTRGTLLA